MQKHAKLFCLNQGVVQFLKHYCLTKVIIKFYGKGVLATLLWRGVGVRSFKPDKSFINLAK